MGLIKAFLKTLFHPVKYQWITMQLEDGSILVGASTEKLWQQINGLEEE